MKDPLFLYSPVRPPTIPSKPSLSTNWDDHLIPLLSQYNFFFKAQLTYLYIYILLTIHSVYKTKIKFFSHPLLLKSCLHSYTGLTMG